MIVVIPFFLLYSVFTSATAAYTWPSNQYDALEQLLYEGTRSDGSSLASIVHPCRKRTGTLTSIGAEWLRFAFHDMATHSVSNGTDGLDGSLVYELDRLENFGLGFTQTLNDFQAYPNILISRADVIAIATIFAVSSCQGPIIPFRGGRIDAWQAGNYGTPEPQQDIATLTESFRNQGFNQTDMIKLVACGHTMGGVRTTDFPQLVPPDPKSTVLVIDNFDQTMQFDNLVVTDYLNNNTTNVLVTTNVVDTNSSVTFASDLRVFESDGNVTMQSLRDATVYQSECRDVLSRMLNTVPSSVTLTDEITLLPAKVKGGYLAFEQSQLVFKASLRLIQPINTTASSNRVVTMLWCDNYGNNQGCKGKTNTALPVSTVNSDPSVSPVTSKLGYFMNYNFVLPINSKLSIKQFWFTVDDKNGTTPTTYDNDGNYYVLDQDQVFLAPMMSSMNRVVNASNTGGFSNGYTLVAAVRDGTNPSKVYGNATDVATTNFAYAMNSLITFSLNSTYPSTQEHSFYSAFIEDSGSQMTLDLHADVSGSTISQQFVQTLLLDNAPYVAPGSVSSFPSTNLGQTTSKTSSASSYTSCWWILSLVCGLTVLSMVL